MNRGPNAIADNYVAAHDRIEKLVAGIDDTQARSPVPGTPDWTVHDLLAHLVAVPSDIAAGRLTSIPTPDQTKAQVEERRDRSIGELLDEWTSGMGPIVEATRAGLIPAPLAIDVITHEQDLRGALGAPPVPDPDAVKWAAGGFASGLARRIKESGLPPLLLRDPDSGFDAFAGDGGPPGATVTAPVFELFRALAGRRSREQVAGYDWDGDASPYLDLFCVFGPLREHDLLDF